MRPKITDHISEMKGEGYVKILKTFSLLITLLGFIGNTVN